MVSVEDPTGQTTLLNAKASDDEAGVYELSFVPSEPGAYVAQIAATAADGSEVGKRSTGWTAEPARKEFRTLRPDRQLLQRIAQQSGGELVEPDRWIVLWPDCLSARMSLPNLGHILSGTSGGSSRSPSPALSESGVCVAGKAWRNDARCNMGGLLAILIGCGLATAEAAPGSP